MKNIIEKIELKVGALVEKCNQLKIKTDFLQQENTNLLAELQKKTDQIAALQERVKLMNISKSVDFNSDDIKATRLKINKYVREIDRCIALLNK